MRNSKINLLRQLRHSLPAGGSLPEDVWRRRHRFLVGLTWFHVAIIALTGPLFGYVWTLSIGAFFKDGTVLHTFGESLVVAFFAALAAWDRFSREFRATAVSFGLMSASAIIVHLSGGYIEFHFHFFVMLVFLALYQDWVPYLFAIAFVAIHHGTVGVLWPSDVYNHPAALNAPWTWAGIHAFFVLWSSVGSVIAWRFNERAYAQTQRILDSAGEGIFGLDCNSITTFINPAAAKMLGLSESAALGQPLARILEHTRADGIPFPGRVSPILASLKNGKPRQGTNEIFRRSDGSSFPADYHVTPTIEQNELTGLVVTFSDATERHRANREIHHHLQRIRALREIDVAITSSLDLRNILDVLLEKIDLFFDYASASTVRLFDPLTGALEPAACRNLDPNEWRTEEWKSGGRIPKMVFETLAPVTITNVQSDPRINNSEIFKKHGIFSYLGVPLIAKGKPLGVLGLYTQEEHQFSKQEVDFMITLAGQAAIAIHNSQLHEEIKKQAQALERSNKIKDDFLSVTSHELRTPLIAIMGYARLLEDQSFGKLLPEQLKAAQVIKNRAEDLLVMIRSILETTKLEAGAMKVEQEMVDVKGLLDGLVRLYEAPLQKEVNIRWDYDGNLPDIVTDGAKLKRILQNLINNSLKFTEQGHVTVSAQPLPAKQSVEFKVADTGIGISETLMPVIFEKFRQADGSAARDHEGIGLGLYIVKQFTQLLGGSIECQSEVGRGSVFTLIIPERLILEE
ncbi:MAG TPA: ATP-binding protein [Candidatus Udaeobacter sp.]|nr:ATP-binding protein [Candidatus Udaeobacter sp.]